MEVITCEGTVKLEDPGTCQSLGFLIEGYLDAGGLGKAWVHSFIHSLFIQQTSMEHLYELSWDLAVTRQNGQKSLEFPVGDRE